MKQQKKVTISGAEYLGPHFGYQCYRGSDGFITGYKSIGGKAARRGLVYSTRSDNPTAIERLVTQERTVEGFCSLVAMMEKRKEQRKQQTANSKQQENTNQLSIFS